MNVGESMALALGIYLSDDETIPLTKRQAEMRRRYHQRLNEQRNEAFEPEAGREDRL